MQFCPACDNKLYVNSKKNLKPATSLADPSPFLYCRTCNVPYDDQQPASGEADDVTGCDGNGNGVADMCVYRSNYDSNQSQDLYFTTIINEYSLFDQTLPILPKDIDTKHACEDCTLRYICYDEANLKFIYLCDVCLMCFKIEEPNTPLFDWRLKPLDHPQPAAAQAAQT